MHIDRSRDDSLIQCTMKTKHNLAFTLSFLLTSASSFSINPCRPPRRATSFLLLPATRTPSTTIDTQNDDISIHYSPFFQRHVVQCQTNVLASFEFLDQAQEAYPNAVTAPSSTCPIIAGGGLEESTAYAMEYDVKVPVNDSHVDTLIEAMSLETSIAEMIKETVPLSRWTGFDSIANTLQS